MKVEKVIKHGPKGVCVFYIEKMKDKPYSHRKKNSCRILRNEKAKSLKQINRI